MKKNKLILYAVLIISICIIIVGIIYAVGRNNTVKKVLANTVLYYDEEGIPPQDSALFEMGGWNNIVNFDQLTMLASSQVGGQMNKLVSYYEEPSKTNYLYIEILGDEETIYLYFKSVDGSEWVVVRKDEIDTPIQAALYQKLQTPLVQQEDGLSPE